MWLPLQLSVQPCLHPSPLPPSCPSLIPSLCAPAEAPACQGPPCLLSSAWARRLLCCKGNVVPCAGLSQDEGGFGKEEEGTRQLDRTGVVVRPRVSVLQVSLGRCPGWSESELGLEGLSGQAEGLTWKAAWAQPRKASSWPHSSSPWPSCRSRSPPSSSSRVSTARAKAQKWGYAREPSPNTQNLGGRQPSREPAPSRPTCAPGAWPPRTPPRAAAQT